MSELTESLRELVNKRVAEHRRKQKERYDLARSLGFSGAEATVLQNWTNDKIKLCANERK